MLFLWIYFFSYFIIKWSKSVINGCSNFQNTTEESHNSNKGSPNLKDLFISFSNLILLFFYYPLLTIYLSFVFIYFYYLFVYPAYLLNIYLFVSLFAYYFYRRLFRWLIKVTLTLVKYLTLLREYVIAIFLKKKRLKKYLKILFDNFSTNKKGESLTNQRL